MDCVIAFRGLKSTAKVNHRDAVKTNRGLIQFVHVVIYLWISIVPGVALIANETISFFRRGKDSFARADHRNVI